jgi:hypothetical protein
MTKKINNDILISPNYPVRKWEIDRIQLINDIHKNANSRSLWEKAYNIFYQRIESRFISPIKWILQKRENRGEGFSIVALQCILIEFLESFYQGLVYTTSENPKPFEYNKSKKLFRDFLLSHEPFSRYFDRPLADGFYDNIRCGLLHEAKTKENSLIKTSQNERIIGIMDDNRNLIVYRDQFYNGIIEYLSAYKHELMDNHNLKINFIRKFDDIADIKRILYFAYGSNLFEDILIDRIEKYHTASKAHLINHKFLYNKRSKKDGTAKANIECGGMEVIGVCYEIDMKDLVTLKNIEKGYDCIDIIIYHEKYGQDVLAKTFKSNSRINGIGPSDDYRQTILKGAEKWDFPKEYIEANLKG